MLGIIHNNNFLRVFMTMYIYIYAYIYIYIYIYIDLSRHGITECIGK